MIAITALKHAAGETVVQLFGQNLQQFIDRQHGIIHGIAGVCCRDFFISDKQERLRRIQLQAIVKHRRQSWRLSFGKADPLISLCPTGFCRPCCGRDSKNHLPAWQDRGFPPCPQRTQR